MRKLFLLCTIIAAAWLSAAFPAAAVQSEAYVIATCGSPPTAFLAGNFGPLTVDANGNLCAGVAIAPTGAAAAGITPVVSAAAENGHVLKNSQGNFYGLTVTTGATPGYVMLLNLAAKPSDGAVTPIECVAVAANTTVGIAPPGPPVAYSTGITWMFSTTGCFTLTNSATAFGSGKVK